MCCIWSQCCVVLKCFELDAVLELAKVQFGGFEASGMFGVVYSCFCIWKESNTNTCTQICSYIVCICVGICTCICCKLWMDVKMQVVLYFQHVRCLAMPILVVTLPNVFKFQRFRHGMCFSGAILTTINRNWWCNWVPSELSRMWAFRVFAVYVARRIHRTRLPSHRFS